MPPKSSARRASPALAPPRAVARGPPGGQQQPGEGVPHSSISRRPAPPVSLRKTGVSGASAVPARPRSSSTVPRGDDPPAQDDADPVAHFLCDLERVRAHQDRDAAAAHGPEDVLDQHRAAGIEAHHGLVDQHRARTVQERGAHDQALLHPVREALDELVAPGAELEQLQQLPGASVGCGRLEPVEPRVEAQQLRGGELLVEEGPVGDEAERLLGPLRLAGEVVSVDRDASGARTQQARDHADGRRLAGPIGAQEAVDLARRDVQADVVDGGEGAEGLDEIVDPDHLRRLAREGEDQQPPLSREGRGRSSGRRSEAGRPTSKGVAPGRLWTLSTSIRARPTRPRMLAWRSRPPRARRTCVASAGNWSRVGSTGSQRPRPGGPSIQTSGQAW